MIKLHIYYHNRTTIDCFVRLFDTKQGTYHFHNSFTPTDAMVKQVETIIEFHRLYWPVGAIIHMLLTSDFIPLRIAIEKTAE